MADSPSCSPSQQPAAIYHSSAASWLLSYGDSSKFQIHDQTEQQAFNKLPQFVVLLPHSNEQLGPMGNVSLLISDRPTHTQQLSKSFPLATTFPLLQTIILNLLWGGTSIPQTQPVFQHQFLQAHLHQASYLNECSIKTQALL